MDGIGLSLWNPRVDWLAAIWSIYQRVHHLSRRFRSSFRRIRDSGHRAPCFGVCRHAWKLESDAVWPAIRRDEGWRPIALVPYANDVERDLACRIWIIPAER